MSYLNFHKLFMLSPGKYMITKQSHYQEISFKPYFIDRQHNPMHPNNHIKCCTLVDCMRMSVHVSKLFLRHNIYLKNEFTDFSCLSKSCMDMSRL